MNISIFLLKKIKDNTSLVIDLFFIFLDMIIGIGLLIFLVIFVGFFIQIYNYYIITGSLLNAGGVANIDNYIQFNSALKNISKDNSNIWIIFMLFSTLIPTLAHIIILPINFIFNCYARTKHRKRTIENLEKISKFYNKKYLNLKEKSEIEKNPEQLKMETANMLAKVPFFNIFFPIICVALIFILCSAVKFIYPECLSHLYNCAEVGKNLALHLCR